MVAAPSCGVYTGKWDGVFVEIEAQIASQADGETVFFSVVGASGSPPIGRLVRRCREGRLVAGGHGGGHEGGNLEDFRISAATADSRNTDSSSIIIIIIIIQQQQQQQQQQHPSINTSIDISSSSSTPASTSAHHRVGGRPAEACGRGIERRVHQPLPRERLDRARRPANRDGVQRSAALSGVGSDAAPVASELCSRGPWSTFPMPDVCGAAIGVGRPNDILIGVGRSSTRIFSA